MSIMGKVLTPILLASLMVILIVGINHTYRLDYGDSQYSTSISAFYTGLREGLNTMDLFASFFFSIIIFPALELHIKKFQNYELTSAIIFRNSLKISSIAMSLLGIIYYGLSFISSHNLVSLKEVDLSKQLANMATLFLGQQASLIANLVVSLACLTTAITLVVIFSEFIVTNTRMFFMPYVLVLTTTIIVSLIMGQLGFGGIVKMLKPVLLLLYPMLIALSIGNILRVFYGFKYSSIFAYLTFATSLTINFL
jgi:LIVCS family branched-chain amino acid:cation transporter